MQQGNEIPIEDGRLLYFEHFLPAPDSLYRELQNSLPWQQPQLTVFGRTRPTRRLVCFVGDPGLSYRYSGNVHRAEPWPVSLLQLRQRLLAEFQLDFNCALVNYYRDGSEQMGYHSDDEPELGAAPSSASVSLGASRDMVFRRKGESRQRFAVTLAPGSLLLMLPPCQAYWQHALPMRKRVSDGRINITFRKIESE